ncbi:MAG TPA: hypothetical protein P5205_04360 [Candidatus Paceibacterota bacterium]|nr:hypothetical protein [Verrucomicrobiota bacterium]HSA09583.1 hypothetical protein [Candidatus Paceibacterota bacterium]
MKKKPSNHIVIVSCALAGLLVAGCAQQQQRAMYQSSPAVTQAPPPPAPPPQAPPPQAAPAAKPSSGYGPSYSTFEENGVRWIRGSMGFPTGLRESSGLLIEKTVPAEVLAGQKFDYAYKVSNLTDYPIQMVILNDRVSPNFSMAEADPKPTEVRDGVATWQLGNMGPKETKTVRLKGSSAEEGSVTTCGWATYRPLLCEDIKVVKANMQLVKKAPAEVVICDPIPMTLTVKNSGSSALTGVKVNDPLPAGLTSDGKTSLAFDAGNLAPGESKEFKFNAVAAKTGEYVNKATAASTQGVTAEATSRTVVREPVLTVACTAPEQRYMGRPFDVSFTVANKGDTAAAGTLLEVPVPAGLTVKSASDGGQATASKITWNLASLAPNASQKVSAVFVAANAGSFQFSSSAKGTCAKLVSSTCQTRVVGVPAILLEKADDPDPLGVGTGETTTYTVKITNQGSADDNNVKMVVTIAPELAPVSATGNGAISGQTVTFPAVPRLAPKEAVTYKIVARGVKAGDGRTRFELNSDMLQSPVIAEESTHVY